MYPPSLQKLIEIFTKFPGIGPRQAGRFAFFLIREKNPMLTELVAALHEVGQKIAFCEKCFRSMEYVNGGICDVCRSSKRDHRIIAIVEKESDMQNLEKTGSHTGLYHVLGGVISPLDSDSPKRLHLKQLYERVTSTLEQNKELCEVILATNSTTEGDMTALYIDRVLAPLKDRYPHLKISRLGRGLSLGSELEHIDEITIRNALINRK